MSSSFRKTVEKLNEQGAGLLVCGFCKSPTSGAKLSQYGGRCLSCYEDYCAAAFAPTPMRNDAPQQAEMRKHLKGAKPRNVLKGEARAEVDRDAAKAEAARRVAEYAQRNGLELEPAEQRARADDRHQTRAPAHVSGGQR